MEPSFHFSQKHQLLFVENASQLSKTMMPTIILVFKLFLAVCQNLSKLNSVLVMYQN